MKEESFKIIIYNSKTGSTIERKIMALRYSDAQQLAETMYGGEGITIMII
jgi:hypothetical protein